MNIISIIDIKQTLVKNNDINNSTLLPYHFIIHSMK